MSDWYRSGRDRNAGRYEWENRERREFGGQERGRPGDRRFDEQRSFEERHPEPARGGFSGESYGGPDPTVRGAQAGGGRYAAREQGGGYGRNEPGEGWGGESWRSQPYDARYGGEGRGQQDWGHSPYAERSWRGREDYGQERRGMVGMNEALQRVSDGGADNVGRDEADMRRFQMGEHRGRGPKNYVRSDERIREDVSDRLSDDSWLDASDIEVTVANCEVTLAGLVRTRDDKRRAEDIVERVSGVRHVQNNLRVQPPRDFPAVT